MRSPRVALVSASTGIQAGGAEAYTCATARGLRAEGVPVSVIHGRGASCPCEEIGATHLTGRLLSRNSALSTLLRRLGVYRATRTSPYDLEVVTRGLFSPHRVAISSCQSVRPTVGSMITKRLCAACHLYSTPPIPKNPA